MRVPRGFLGTLHWLINFYVDNSEMRTKRKCFLNDFFNKSEDQLLHRRKTEFTIVGD